MFSLTILAAAVAAQPQPAAKADDLAAINAACHDYLDGQLQGDPARVARSLHPDLAKRAAIGETADERFALRRMTKEELVDLTLANGAPDNVTVVAIWASDPTLLSLPE